MIEGRTDARKAARRRLPGRSARVQAGHPTKEAEIVGEDVVPVSQGGSRDKEIVRTDGLSRGEEISGQAGMDACGLKIEGEDRKGSKDSLYDRLSCEALCLGSRAADADKQLQGGNGGQGDGLVRLHLCCQGTEGKALALQGDEDAGIDYDGHSANSSIG